MERRSLGRTSLRAAAVMSVTLFTASPALAALHAYAPDGGAHVYDSYSRDRLNVNDSKCDSRYAYGNWNGTTGNRLENRSGCSTTVWKAGLGIHSLRACTEYGNWPDSCSSWKSY